MTRRTLDDWAKLIEQQAQSDLSILAFCKQHHVPTSNFYKYRHKVKRVNATSAFVKAKMTTNVTTKPVAAPIHLAFGDTKLTLPEHCEPTWLAELIKALHA
jgi:putative transposase